MTPENAKGWILVVDDTEAMRYATARMLRAVGWTVVEAATGLEALEQVRRLPELVVLDINLPDLDGFEISRRIKSDPATASIPVLHVTATVQENEYRVLSLEGGADAFLSEPFEARELLATVNALLRMKSAEVYRSLVDQMRNGLAFCRMLFEDGRPVDWIYLSVNRAFEEQTGLVDVVGRSISELIPGIRETSPDLFELYGRVALTGKPEQIETWVEGLKSWLAISVYSPAREHFVAIFDVITERRDAERVLLESHETLERRVAERTRELAEAEARFRNLFEHHGAVMLLVEPASGSILDANDAAAEFYGYGKPALRTMRISSLNTLPEDQIAAERAKALEEKRNYFVFLHRLSSGEERTVEVHSSPIDLPAGRVLFSIIHDITERRRAEEALRESRSLLKSIIEGTPDAIYAKDAQGRYLLVNVATERGLGRSAAEILGRDDTFLLRPEEAALVRDVDREILETGATRTYEETVMGSAGGATLLTTKGPLRDGSGRVVGLFGISRDITDRKEAVEALQRLQANLERRVVERTAELEEVNRELEAFSYSVSHELRSPVRSIDAYSALVAETLAGGLDDEGRRLFGKLRWNAQRMGRLIDDLLDFSRAGRAGQADLVPGPVDMTACAKAAFDLAVPDSASRSKISLSVDDLPEAHGEARLLQRVWVNLLSNAVKFSAGREPPEIHVEGGAVGGEAVYRVRDNGVGFDMKYAGKLFGVFHRLQGQTEFEGTGVGLALVRRIVLRHGGRVQAEGAVDGGATFTFTLPVAPAVVSVRESGS